MNEHDPLYDVLTKTQREAAFNDLVAADEMSHFDRLNEPFLYTQYFHQAFKLPHPAEPKLRPSVTERELRVKLLLEEFLETVTAMGFRIRDNGLELVVEHVEGSMYDPVETLNGLVDLEVIANGTAVALGLPMREERHEVFCSNMSKLGPDGEPIINGVTEGYRGGTSGALTTENFNEHRFDPELGFRPDLPIGKVLKPDTYIKANSAAVFVRHYYATKGE